MDSTPLPLDLTTRRRRKNVSNSASSLSQSAMFAGNEVSPNSPNNTFFAREEEKNTKYSANTINTDDHVTSTNNLPASQRKKETLLSSLNKKRNDKLYNLFKGRHKKCTYSEEEEEDDKTSSDDNNNNNATNGAHDSDYNEYSGNNTECNRDRMRRNVLQFASSKVNVANTSEKDAYGNDADDTFIWKCRCSASILIAIAIWMAVMMTIFLVISDSTKTRETHALNAETAYNASLQHESYEMETKHVNRLIESSPSLHSSSFHSSTSTPSLSEKRVYTTNSFYKHHNNYNNNNFISSDHANNNNNNNNNQINNDLINTNNDHHILRREKANTSIGEDKSLHKTNSVDDELHGDAFDAEMKIHVCPHGSVCRERVYEDHMQRKLSEEMNEYLAQHKLTITDQNGNDNHVGNYVHQNISEDVEEVLPYNCKGQSCIENDANGLEFGIEQGSHDGVTAYSNCNYHSCYSFYDHVIEVHVHDNLESMNKAALNKNDNKAWNTSNTPVTLNEPLPKRMSSGMKWQCVEYARRYWMLRGKPLPAYFESVYGAADIWNFNEVLLLDGTHIPLWKFANNGSIISPTSSHDTQTDTITDHSDPSNLLPFTSNIPNVGDLLLWERNVTADIPHGHVAVIVSVDTERHLIYVAEQNWDSSKWPAPHLNYSRSLVLSTNDEGYYVIQDDGLKLIGWVRYVVPESKLR